MHDDDTESESTVEATLLKDSMAALKDPATMKEVEKLMSDPAFIKEMEKIKSDPNFAGAVQSAKDLYGNYVKAAQVFGQLNSRTPKEGGILSDAQLGMHELSKAMKNPAMLAEAMELLKDPETAAEVTID